jgi:DNA-binding SARP family transcriptional activator
LLFEFVYLFTILDGLNGARVGMIQYRLLGPAEIKVDGRAPPPELRWRKNLALAVYLMRSQGKPTTRDHLIGLLWAEKPEKSARHSLREALRAIRKKAGPEHLKVEGEQVTLETSQADLDLDRFHEFTETGDFESAWGLVRGGFMEDFSVPGSSGFEDWLLSERMA